MWPTNFFFQSEVSIKSLIWFGQTTEGTNEMRAAHILTSS